MPTTSRDARRCLALLGAGSLGLATLVTGLTLAPAQAASTGLVISEAYGGGGNSGATFTHDFVEIHNPTSQPISVDGMSVQYRSSGSTSAASGVTELSGTVPAGGYYLVQQAQGSGGTQALPTPDATGSIAMSGTAFTVWLAEGTTALNPPAGSLTTVPGVVDLLGVNSNTWEGPTKAAGTSNTTSSARTAPDADHNGAEFVTGAPAPQATGGQPEPEPDPDPTVATIPEIQGTGEESPLVGTEVVTTGVVTAVPEFLFGFYLQTPGTGGVQRAQGAASDGVFVYFPRGAGDVTVQPGQHVKVTGEVAEFAGATQVVSSEAEVEQLGTPSEPVTAYAGEWPATDAAKESLEGMLVDVSAQEFTVTNTYSTNQFGEVGLALGDTPLLQPTEVADAQDTAAIAAVVADNAARAIVLDDGSSTDYTRNGSLTPPYVSNAAPVRVGASATFTEPVVLTEGGSPSNPTYRFQPTVSVSGPDYTATSPAVFEDTRTAAPEEVGGDVSVASFNVLNYFTTLGDADDDNVGDGGCTAFTDRAGDGNNVRGGCDQRGAWDPQDFSRQQEKIVAAINALDADVVGLMEIENSARLGEEADEATRSLVAALNAAAGFEKWAANPSSSELPATSEQDVITNAIIFQPAAVERVGESRALGEQSGAGEAFDNAREPLGQVFAPVGGGEELLVVVNHFKSKGSGEDDGTGQGNANPDRVAQATALRDWVPGIAADTGTEAIVLLGDFNSYAQEDPMQVLYEGGYENTTDAAETPEWSYSFSGLSGSLDHVLANGAAMEALTGVDTWNINSDESVALEYSRFNVHATDFHQSGPFRSSDHDPVKIGLDLVEDAPELAASSVEVEVRPKQPKAGKGRLVLKVEVDSAAGTPSGTVTVTAGGEEVTAELKRSGKVVVTMRNPFEQAGTYPVTVRYSGDEATAASEETVEVRVRR
ncbi:ExeM/NucH family extracellular endonuclease [Nocardioides sp.]|uniref:ExeM/NucH family extracellular endonuclease n=1 Tax=Nocardioides sp. TaxID=35761 RepID=UPI0026033746|nr:ExeM/NucH family extracellular endonuclease [Nocardioides sp.]